MKAYILGAISLIIATLAECRPAEDVRKPQAISPAPIVISSPVNQTSEGLTEELESIFNAATNRVAPCDQDAKEQCNSFIATDGSRCYTVSSQVHCDTHSGDLCSDDAVEFCYDFINSNSGLYCTNGSCNILING
ncbi:unnamed protein product [Mucor hiemalis]